MRKKLIYIADDEINIRNIIKLFLEKDNFDVDIFDNGELLLKSFKEKPSDMLILDIMMPGMDGYSLCAEIRKISSVPIIMVSAKDTESDKIIGLTIGSDDYMTKPFSPLELIARVKTIFRRIEFDKNNSDESEIINISDIKLNNNTKQVEVNGSSIRLTCTEFSLLYYLIINKSKAVSRNELLDKIWGFESKVETRATDDMIKRIRKKLKNSGSKIKIETVWGFGFKIID
ncbi:MAG: response regulator transcription factor [Clostridiales bacterium]